MTIQLEKLQIDKAKVAQRFAQAGQSYAEQAVVQQRICQRLMQLMTQSCTQTAFDRVFEIGCGSGNLSHLLMQNFVMRDFILNDLYPQVQQHFPAQGIPHTTSLHWLIADIEQATFPTALNLIASSSALQWISNLDRLFQRAAQALLPQGWLCFSTFGANNLNEIKVLTGIGLDYLSLASIQEKLIAQGFEILHLSEQIETLNFAHPKQVLQHLKATGVTATAVQYRWSKQSLQQFYLDYQQFSVLNSASQRQYVLSYHPIYCIARRKT